MGKRIAVDELHCPVQQADNTLQTTKCNHPHDVALLGFLLLSYGDGLPKHVDQGNDQGAERDAAKGVCHSAAECTSSDAAGHSTWLSGAEEPASVDAGDGGVQGILQPFGYPVSCKGDEDYKPDDFGRGTSCAAGSTIGIRLSVGSGLVSHIYANQRDGVPGAESECDEATDGASGEYMAGGFGDVNGGLQH